MRHRCAKGDELWHVIGDRGSHAGAAGPGPMEMASSGERDGPPVAESWARGAFAALPRWSGGWRSRRRTSTSASGSGALATCSAGSGQPGALLGPAAATPGLQRKAAAVVVQW